MEIKVTYNGLEDRTIKVKEYEDLNEATGFTWRMLTDNFDDPNWKQGDPIVGTMTFTDVQPLVIPDSPDVVLLKTYLSDPHSGLPDLEEAFQALARLYLGR